MIHNNLIIQLSTFMQETGLDYALCGGYAIDLFIGKKTRPHKDIDVVIFQEDRDKIIQFMLNNGWDVYEPCGTDYLHKINIVSDQIRNRSNIWCVLPDNPHYKFTEHEKDMYAVECDNSEQTELDYIEFLFNTRKNDTFLYARNHDIQMGLDKAILKSEDIPYLAPEIVLLYKSTDANNPEYHLDFINSSMKMTKYQLKWLMKSLSIMFPNGHKWLVNEGV